MLQRLRAARKNQNGFTLTELLIVIVILGVLAGIVVFAVAGITERGTTAACQADVRTVQTAVEAFKAETGLYPAENDYAELKRVELLRDAPASSKYKIEIGNRNGIVTGTLTPGGNCFPVPE